MQSFNTYLILALVLTFSLSAAADSLDELITIMKKNKKVRCDFLQDTLVQTKSGELVAYNETDIFSERAPEASSSLDFATYSLAYEGAKHSFYYYMNSQVGEIRIKDKTTGFSAESNLDISDLDKKQTHVGEARLIQRKDIDVIHPQTEEKVAGESITTLSGSCYRIAQ